MDLYHKAPGPHRGDFEDSAARLRRLRGVVDRIGPPDGPGISLGELITLADYVDFLAALDFSPAGPRAAKLLAELKAIIGRISDLLEGEFDP